MADGSGQEHAPLQGGQEREREFIEVGVGAQLLPVAHRAKTVTALDAAAATGVLAAACNPDTFLPASAAMAGADDIVTAAPLTDLYDDDSEGR